MPSAVIHRSKLFLSHCISLLGGSNHRLGSKACKNHTKDGKGVSAPSVCPLPFSVSFCLSLTLCVWWAAREGCLFPFFSDTMPLDLQFKNEIWGTKIFEDEPGRKKKLYISFSVWTNLEIHLNNNPNFSRVSCSPISHIESEPRDLPLCEEQLLHFHQLQ